MKEVLASLVLVALLILILNPFHFWMPMPVHIVVLGAMTTAFGVLAAFVMREGAADEREAAHRMHAGRVAFIAGATVLLLGVIFQSFNHAVDPWIVAALVAMLIAKLAARVYGDYYR